MTLAQQLGLASSAKVRALGVGGRLSSCPQTPTTGHQNQLAGTATSSRRSQGSWHTRPGPLRLGGEQDKAWGQEGRTPRPTWPAPRGWVAPGEGDWVLASPEWEWVNACPPPPQDHSPSRLVVTRTRSPTGEQRGTLNMRGRGMLRETEHEGLGLAASLNRARRGLGPAPLPKARWWLAGLGQPGTPPPVSEAAP